MGVIIVHHGLGLWVDRGEHWEVLFPDARQRDVKSGKERLQSHHPILFVPKVNRGVECKAAYDLEHAVLDMTSIAEAGTAGAIAQPFMLGLGAEGKAPVLDPNAATTSEFVVGAIKLKKGILSPAFTPLVGPVEFDDTRPRMVAYAVSWTSFCDETASITLRPRQGSPRTIALKADNAGNMLLYVQNLSLEDVHDDSGAGSPRLDDPDFGAHYVLTQEVQNPDAPIPRKKTKRKDVESSVTQTSSRVETSLSSPFLLRFLEHPHHLCTTAYLR
jgi:hypothetical protein